MQNADRFINVILGFGFDYDNYEGTQLYIVDEDYECYGYNDGWGWERALCAMRRYRVDRIDYCTSHIMLMRA